MKAGSCLWRLRRSENSSTLDLRPTQDAMVADIKRVLCVADLSASQVIAGSSFCSRTFSTSKAINGGLLGFHISMKHLHWFRTWICLLRLRSIASNNKTDGTCSYSLCGYNHGKGVRLEQDFNVWTIASGMKEQMLDESSLETLSMWLGMVTWLEKTMPK